MRTDTPPAGDTPEPPSPTTSAPAEPVVVRRKRPRTALWAIIGIVVVVVIILAAGASLGWFKTTSSAAKPGACPTGVTLSGSGASFLYTIEQVWSASYATSTSNAVTYNPGGAGTGITAFTDKTVDFAATDEGLTSVQFAALPSTALTLPAVAGALAIVVNLPGVATPIKLNGTVLAEIYLGKVTTWNNANISAINPGVSLPSNSIVPVVRSGGAGTTFVITSYMAAHSSAWATGPGVGIDITWPSIPNERAESSNSALAEFVNATSYSIGYVDLADALNTHGGLSITEVQNSAGAYIYPTPANTNSAIETIANATTFPGSTGNWANVSFANAPGAGNYPMAAMSYFLVYQKVDAGYEATTVAKAQVLVQWLSYVMASEQQGAAGPNNYVPVPSKLVQQNLAAIASMTFDGSAIPACTTG